MSKMRIQLQLALLLCKLGTYHDLMESVPNLSWKWSFPILEIMLTKARSLLAEARKTERDSNKKLQNLVESLEQQSSKNGLTQVCVIIILSTFFQ